MIIRVGLLGGDELVRRGLESMLRTLGGFELGSFKDRMRAPIDIALIETFGTPLDDTTLARLIKFGLPGSPMAGHETLPDPDILSLAAYVKSLHAPSAAP